ncbi:MAG: hypothetical protein C4325_10735 [Blastocatellia bacterium]
MIEPVKIVEESESAFSIEWSDGRRTSYTAAQLRRVCPCAGCVDEWTGEKRLDESAIPDDLAFNGISIVGRYALNFSFADGHDSGIFSFDYLRRIAA